MNGSYLNWARKLSGSFQPSLEKKSSWLCTCPDRSLTNFSVWVVPWSSSISNTSPLSFMRMFAPNWRMIVIGVNGGMNCCLPSVDMGSSSTRNRINPFTPTIPAGKSRTCTTLAEPIPPHVAIMLVGVTSMGTGPCRLRSRSHHRRAADDPTTGCCAPVSCQATSWSQDQTNKLRMLRIRVAHHHSLGSTIKQHVRRQIMQLCKGTSWQKKNSWL